eukprot:PITA_20922
MDSKRFTSFSFRGSNAAASAKTKSINDSGPLDYDGSMIEEIKPYLMEDCPAMVRKVMVVVDATREARRALIWVLTHSLLKHDRLILLHVAPLPPSTSKDKDPPFSSKRYTNPMDSALLNSLKAICAQRRPEVYCADTMVEVEVMIVGGKEKGPTILHNAKRRSASLLVLGQPKPPLLQKLRSLWSDGKSANKSEDSAAAAAVVEYCIQNAECMCVAVRKKNQKVGGYLISTKKHKDFWLLA